MIRLRGKVPRRLLKDILSVVTISDLPGPFDLVVNDDDETLSLYHRDSGICLSNELLLTATLKRERGSIPPVERVTLTRYRPDKDAYGLVVYLKERR